MSTRRPWITADQRVSWFGADCQTEVRFDPDGISRIQRGEELDRFPWAQVADLEIKVPYAPPWLWRLGVVGNLISPKSFEYSSDTVSIAFGSRFQSICWDLGPHERYSWRLQFVLDDLVSVLTKAGSLAALGHPEVLNGAVDRVMPRIKHHARALLYVDLLGLDRFVGGHGAFDADLLRLADSEGS